jgi:stage II sporulation protein D
MAVEENPAISIRMTEEPTIKVGILERYREINGRFNGPFRVHDGCLLDGDFRVRVEAGCVIITDAAGRGVTRQKAIRCAPLSHSTFTLFGVTIGVHFHWERKQEQTFRGTLSLIPDENETLAAINEILLEDYLTSVISSEMSAEAPLPFLKAHAITSRSWLVATLNRSRKASDSDKGLPALPPKEGEIVRWYGRVDHRFFDVCADDHCQRYQGITRLISTNARDAIDTTRGVFLIYNDKVCDTRYHKACGGLTDNFENTWEDTPVPYLTSVSDSDVSHHTVCTETDAERWILSSPDVYCHTGDENILRQVLPSFDQETTDFFRWKVVYDREVLEQIIREKSGMDMGNLLNLTPIERGPSGRIIRLKIEGSKKTVVIGKELEIRRWLSHSHLYSSAFFVSVERDPSGLPTRFILLGAGWGHGVGLCQIGAAVMATKGYSAEEILKHYFRGTEIKKLY